jgi:hypothetical protein
MVAAISKKVIKQHFSNHHIDMVVIALAIDILKEGELVEPHLIAMLSNKPFKSFDKQRQDLVNIDDDQRAIRGNLGRNQVLGGFEGGA